MVKAAILRCLKDIRGIYTYMRIASSAGASVGCFLRVCAAETWLNYLEGINSDRSD